MTNMPFVHRIRDKYFPTLAEQLGYSNKDILLIVNIDDIGMHKNETDASFKALNFGIVKSGSVMVPCPNFNQVIKLWKGNPEIDLGIHFTLTCEWGERYPWTPVLSKAEVPSLYNPEGIMWPTLDKLLQHAKGKEINMELEAQVNKILDTGLKPTHIDYHMDFHHQSDSFSTIMEISQKYNLPMRVSKRRKYRLPFFKNNLISLRRRGYVFPDTQMGIYVMGGQNQTFDFRKAKYFNHLRSLRPGVHNIKIHIAFQTEELQNIMGKHHSSIRQIDYDVWSSDETKKLVEELGIILIGFRPLQQLQRDLMKKPFAK